MLLALHNKYQISLLGFLQFLPDLLAQNRIFWGRRGGIFVCDMPVSCMICLKAIQGLGGGPICFLLLLIHTLNILFYEFDSNASINFLTFKCHTQKNGTDLRRSPPLGKPSNLIFRKIWDFVPTEGGWGLPTPNFYPIFPEQTLLW